MSSWEPPPKGVRNSSGAETVSETARPQEVRVKKGYTWTQELGIAVAALVDNGKMALVEWVKQVRSVSMLQAS